MGFKRGALVLEWPEDSEFSGLEIRMRRLSIGQLLRVEELFDELKAKDSDNKALMTELLDIVGDGLLSWNYEDDNDTPLPAERSSLDAIDADMILMWVRAWTKGAATVPLASPPSLPTGEPAPPDEEWASFLAQNQESLPAPASS
jgi:hypothetical protein